MNDISAAGTFRLGDRTVNRLGYGAMQLAGPACSGRPRTVTPRLPCCARRWRAASITSTPATITARTSPTSSSAKRCIPTRDDLVIVTKIGARRGDDASWNPAIEPAELRARCTTTCAISGSTCSTSSICGYGSVHDPPKGSIEAPSRVLAELQRQGLVRHLGLSNVTSTQIEGRRIAPSSACRTSTIWRIATTMR